MTLDLNLQIHERLTALEDLLGFEIPKDDKNMFVAVIISAATYNEHKLNELYHLYKYNALETYGDAILDLLVCEILFESSRTQKEMTIKRSNIVNNLRLHEIGQALLLQILITTNYDEKDKITYAKALERLIGAMYYCFGRSKTEAFIKKHNILTE